jgi:hypothetical protein
MNTAIKLDPIISEFETAEQEDHYNEWLGKKVRAAMADTRPSLPHDEAMAHVDELLQQKREARKAAGTARFTPQN